MITESVFRKRKEIELKYKILNQELAELLVEEEKLQDRCQHLLVVLLNDDYPKKHPIAGTCFCPACTKTLQILKEEHLSKSIFGKSDILDIRKLSLFPTRETLNAIKKEISDNYELYYNMSIPSLESLMIEKLSDYEVKYENNSLKRQFK